MVDPAEQVFLKPNGSHHCTKENNHGLIATVGKKRKAFRIAKMRSKNHDGTTEKRKIMKENEKAFKREMNKAMENYRIHMKNKLKDLKSNNS